MAGLVLLVVGSSYVKHQIESYELDKVGQNQKVVLFSTQNRTRAWATNLKNDSEYWAGSALVTEYAEELLKTSKVKGELLASPAQKKLRELLNPKHMKHDYRGFFIVSPDRVSLSSSRDDNIGTINLLTKQIGFFEDILSGQIKISLPQKSDVPQPGRDGVIEENALSMFVGAPIRNAAGNVIAVFTLRLSPFDGFFDIFYEHHVDETGDIFSFDKEGRMVAISHAYDPVDFNHDLHPFDRQIKFALSNDDVAIVEGYRGVKVVGNWLWDPNLDLGFGVEMDYEKAYAPVKNSNLLIDVSACFAGLLLLGFVVFNFRNRAFIQQINKAKESAQKSEEGLNQAQSIAKMGSWCFDATRGELNWSDEFYRILGLNPGEIEPSYKQFLAVVHPDDVGGLKSSVEEYFVTGDKCSFDHRVVLPNTEVRWVHEEVEVVFDGGNNPLRLQGTVHDISRRKQMENELSGSNELMKLVTETQNKYLYGREMKTVFKSMLAGVIDLTRSEYGFIGEVLNDSNGAPFLKTYAITDISWNKETRALYKKFEENGFEFRNLETLFGQTLKTGKFVISNDPKNDIRSGGLPEGHPQMSCYLGLPFNLSGEMVGMIGLANCPDGYDETIVEFMQPVLNSCAYIFDKITSEKTLKESEEKFRRLVESSMDAVVLFDGEKFIDANPAALELFACNDITQFCQYSPVDLSPETQSDGSDSQLLAKAMIDKTFTQGNHRFEWLHKTVDGVLIPTEISMCRIEISGKQMLQAVIRDISEKKRVEHEKTTLQKQLLQAQKMESLGQLTGGIAHDFNNILTSIIGFADLGGKLGEGSTVEELHDCLNEVRKAGNRAKGLIEQMLAFSRGNSEDDLRPLVIRPLIIEVIKLLQPVLPSSISIRRQFDEDVPVILADAVKVHQVLMNLFVNASDALDGCGNIDIELHVVHEKNNVCTSCHKPVNGVFVEVIVRDDGPGIDPEKLSNVFEPFFTTKEAGKGTGMGLSVVHGILHGHSGHVIINSNLGEGTEFRLLFPAAEDVAVGDVNTENDNSWNAEARGVGQHILVVDDEEPVAKFLELLLEKDGYKVRKFCDSVAALSYFSDNPDEFDLIITDQTMPGMIGSQMAAVMLALRPEVPIILCTGFSNIIDKESAEAIGVRAFFTKPINIQELLDSVSDLIENPTDSWDI